MKKAENAPGFESASDTDPEIVRLQNTLWMARSAQERNMFAARMHAAARRVAAATIEKGSSEREFKRRLYKRLYGEDLPADFF